MSSNNNPTLTISTPSIALQRIILLIFLTAIGAMVWWQNSGGAVNYANQKFSLTPLPQAIAELDFTNAEASWSNLRFDSQGNLKIDAQTEPALLDAIALLDEQSSEQQLTRMALLLEKQFGAKASENIMTLLFKVKNYKEIEQRWWEEHGGNNLSANKPPAYGELFKLQDELLGESLATKLFAEQRRLAQMMLASQQIQNDSSLTQAEKDRALQELQLRFQEGAPNDE